MIAIRPAEPADAADISTMKNFDCTDLVARRLEAMAAGAVDYLVAVDGAQVVGHVCLNYRGTLHLPDYPDIEDLRVLEARRSEGIGTMLLMECEARAKRRGFRRVGLAVNPDLNPRALALYRRLGYHIVSETRYLDGVYDGVEDWVIDMVKVLF